MGKKLGAMEKVGTPPLAEEQKTSNPCPTSIFCVTIFIIELRDLRDFPGDVPECSFNLGASLGPQQAFLSCCLYQFRYQRWRPKRRGCMWTIIRLTRSLRRIPTRFPLARKLNSRLWMTSTPPLLNCIMVCGSVK